MTNDLLLQQLRASPQVDERGLEAACARSASTGEDLASACWSLKLVPERELVRLLCRLHGYPGIDLSSSVLRLANLELVPEDVVLRKLALPVLDNGSEIMIAMADPEDAAVYDELRFLTGRKVMRHVGVPAAIRAAADAALAAREAGEQEWRGSQAWSLEPPPEGRAAVVHPGESGGPGAPPLVPLGPPSVEEERVWLEGFLEGLELPARRSEAPPPPPAAPAPPQDPSATVKIDSVGAGKTVLVVDDDPEMRAMELKLLQPLGCAAVETGDGKEALALARELRPDVVLLDGMLPGMHGFEVCRAIKGDPELRRTGIVMISGIYTGWRIGADLKEAYGADYFFEKPFRIAEVTRAVRVLLLGGSGAQAMSRARRGEALAACQEALVQARAGKHAQAIALLHGAVHKDPFSAEPHFYLGQVLRQAGQPYQALASLERAVDLRPDLDPPLALLGELYLQLGFRKTARDVFARALDACSDAGRSAQLRARLAAIGRG